MNNEPEPIISCRNIHRAFGKHQVLTGLTMDVHAGNIVALLGPSGAGKTTLVKMIAGTDTADEGEVNVLDITMPAMEILPKIGYMAQSDALYLELSGQENLEFFGSMYGLSGKKLQTEIERSAGLVNLNNHLQKQVRNYSGGMKRRLSLAITLLHKPTILILDEPTVGLDPVLRQDVWEELRKYASQGATILITTHVMDETERCDSVCLLREGKIIAQDTPQKLIETAGVNSMQEAFLYFAATSAAKRVS